MLSDLTGDGVMDFIPYGNPFPRRVYDMTTLPFTDYRDQLFTFNTGWGPDAVRVCHFRKLGNHGHSGGFYQFKEHAGENGSDRSGLQ